jgi:outer membrane lipoprotein SlyB
MPGVWRPMSRSMRRTVLTLALVASLDLAGCSQASAPPANAPAQSLPQAGVEYGVIASLRPVARPIGGPGASILAAVGMGGAAGAQAAVPAETEFVIRADDGRTLSVMQPNDQDFHAGERVALSRGARTRIVRLGSPES